MRLLFCLVLSLSLNVLHAQDAPGIVINENFSEAPLSRVIRVLKNKYDIKVAYDDALVTGITVNGRYTKQPLTRFLDSILADKGIDYQILNGKIILTPKLVDLALDQPSLFDLTIYGIVTDAETGETLPNALIRVEGSSVGTISNSDGYFSLPKVPSDTSTIVVSYLGYKKNDIQLEPGRTRETLKIRMEMSVKSLGTFVLLDEEGDKIKYGDDISQITINPQALYGLPTLGELDVFRSLQLLPGISGSSENASGLNIRSSTSAQNLVLFDGFPIYRLDHFFGVFSAINSDAVRDIQVLKGGYNARYGGRISGVVDITGKTGNFNQPTFNFGMNFLSARMSLNAPLNSGKGAIHISYRRAFTDIIRSRLFDKLYDLYGANQQTSESNDIRPDFNFRDLHVKATYNVSTRDVLSLSYYRSKDILSLSSEETLEQQGFAYITNEKTEWSNTGLGFTWSRNWSSRSFSSLTLSRSEYSLSSEFSEQFITNDNTFRGFQENRMNEIEDLQLSYRHELDIGTKHDLEMGLQFSNLQNQIAIVDESDRPIPVSVSDLAESGSILSLYITDKFNISKKLQLTTGLRYELTNVTNQNYLGHRLALSYRPFPALQLKAATGQFFQYVNDIVWDDPRNRNQNFWLLARPRGSVDPSNSEYFEIPRLISNHYIAGLNYSRNGWLMDVEYFEKTLGGLLDVSISYESLIGDNPTIFSQQISRGEGYVRGMDFLIQKNVGPYQGWVAYTLSKAQNRFANINEGEFIRARQDQRHEVKWVNSFSFQKWNLSATWIWGSGKPFYTPRVRFVRDNTGQVIDYDLINTEKVVNALPDYQRVDLSIAYKFESPNSRGEMGLSLFNVLNHTNVQTRELDLSQIDANIALGEQPRITFRDIQLLNFAPSFFFNLNF